MGLQNWKKTTQNNKTYNIAQVFKNIQGQVQTLRIGIKYLLNYFQLNLLAQSTFKNIIIIFSLTGFRQHKTEKKNVTIGYTAFMYVWVSVIIF